MTNTAADKILAKLNENQREAASSDNSRTLIIAGAGTGKTQTLTSRVAYLIAKGEDPKSILLLTFTNKAAKEMQKRAIKLVGDDAKNITACTFHSFCNTMLRKYGHYLNIPQEYAVLTPAEERNIYDFVKGRDKDVTYPKGFVKNTTIMNLASESFNKNIKLEDLIKQKYESKAYNITPYAIHLLEKVNDYKRQTNQFNFDDLMKEFLKLMDTPAKNVIHNIYKNILVDEYQDTNDVQEEILDKLTETRASLTVVGDDYQSIYGFRGANIKHFLSFEDRNPNCKSVILNRNYRSTQEILNFANSVMKKHADFGYFKQMKSDKKGAKPIHLLGDENNETAYVIDKIKELLANGTKPSEIAVLSSKSKASAFIQVELKDRNIPFEVRGGQKFLDREDVCDILTFQKILAHVADETKWCTTLKLIPNIGDKRGSEIAMNSNVPGFLHNTKYENAETETEKKMCRYLHEMEKQITDLRNEFDFQKQTEDLINYYISLREAAIKDTGKNKQDDTYEEMIHRLNEFKYEIAPIIKNLVMKHDNLYDWLDYIALDGQSDEEENTDNIILSTIHSAKGLEWENVFVIHCTDGELPMTNPYHPTSQEEIDEALRCFYVAITRAKTNLVISSPVLDDGWSLFPKKSAPTRFIKGSDEYLVKEESV